MRVDGLRDSSKLIMSSQEVVIDESEIETLNRLIDIYEEELRSVTISLVRLDSLQAEFEQVKSGKCNVLNIKF